MEWVEEEGRTIEKALRKALKKMEVTRNEVEVEVLEENRGMMAYLSDKAVRIKVSLVKNERKGGEDATKHVPPREVALNTEGRRLKTDGIRNDIPPSAFSLQPSHDRECLDEAKKVLGDILNRMGISCTLEGTSKDNEISLNILSDKGGLIIGKRGETVDALQHIVSKILNKGGQEKLGILLDAEKYRERRKERIRILAENLAAKVKETGRPATLEEMSSQDRKVIHMTLQGDDRIQTESLGDGMFKKVIISLREKHQFK